MIGTRLLAALSGLLLALVTLALWLMMMTANREAAAQVDASLQRDPFERYRLAIILRKTLLHTVLTTSTQQQRFARRNLLTAFGHVQHGIRFKLDYACDGLRAPIPSKRALPRIILSSTDDDR